MSKRLKIIGLILLFAIIILRRESLFNFFRNDSRTVNESEVKLLFSSEPSLDFLVKSLVENGVLNSTKEFKTFVRKNKIDSTNFAAGKYVIFSKTQLHDLVNGFQKGANGQGNAEVKVNVVFNRCRTIEDIGANISKCILADSASIVEFINNPDTHKKYGFTKSQMPAMFLPKKYKMYFDTDAETFFAFMANEFKQFWNAERISKMKKIGLKSPSQTATLASIVYSEQEQMEAEWPIIAKLYLNRLNKSMKLQSDPTFKFCWGSKLDGVERLLFVHRNIDCAYNTYKIDGLPPGPICITPGEVIDAVLDPADVDYLFMCGKPGGVGHAFAVTNSEHERNVAVYKVWLKKYLAN